MSLSEFSLIDRYFTLQAARRDDVVLGVGDDAALVRVPRGMELALAMDTLVEGVHFPEGTDPASIGYKALAVNLSDLAAMGARPAWATLALTLPRAEEEWLEEFSRGFFRLADRHKVVLVGGDTTRGPLSVTVQAHGLVAAGRALRRFGAAPGDGLYVSGSLGEAALGLKVVKGDVHLSWDEEAAALARLNRPQPRVALGRGLPGIASAAIDISDGLAADLDHILAASGVGAEVLLGALPLSEAVRRWVEKRGDWSLPLAGGDDYELLFTVPAAREPELAETLEGVAGLYTRIGQITAAPGIRWLDTAGEPVALEAEGYLHFR